jgi:sugar lactone lactonase YvrE
VAPDGSVYLAESVGNRIRRVLPDGTIQTVAGSRSQSFTGDGGPARAATFHWPAAVAVAPDGSVYVSDHYNNRVRRISPGGVISTVAGTGEEAFSGDGGPAREAALARPAGLAIEPDGSLLVADSGNNRIRRIRDGVITTLAGTGRTAPGEPWSGDGSRLIGDGGPALDASLHKPMGVEVDGDGYLVADTYHHKIRRIDRDGVITTVAGRGTRGYGVDGVPATDTDLLMPAAALRMRDGRMVVADTEAKRVRVMESDGTISGVAGNYYYSFSGNSGPAAQAQVSSPVDVTVAPDGDVYLLENVDGWVIRRISASSGRIDAVMGLAPDREPPADGSPSLTSYLASAQALAELEGMLYVTDGHVIRQIDLEAGTQRVYAGIRGVGLDAGDGMDRLQATFVRPTALLAGPDGSLYVGDVGASRVRRIAPDGVVHAVAGTGTAGFSGDGGPAREAELNWPSSLGMDAAGTLYIADSNNDRIRAVAADGTIRTVAGAGPGLFRPDLPAPAASAVIHPRHLTVLPDDSLVFTEGFWDLLRYDPVTRQVHRLAGTGDAGWRDGPAATSRFSFPNGLAWHDETGQILVADTRNNRIRAVSGALTEPAGAPEPAPAPEPEPEPEPEHAGAGADRARTDARERRVDSARRRSEARTGT